MNGFSISVVIPTRNPNLDRLREVLAALVVQTLPHRYWEICIVDNGSTSPLRLDDLKLGDFQIRIVREERAGLLWARICGLNHTASEYVVFIDDDTIPDVNFLAAGLAFMNGRPHVGTAGGKVLPRYLTATPDWLAEFAWLLALRDNGPLPLEWSVSDNTVLPNWTPIGAGLLIRRVALVPGYIEHVDKHAGTIENLSWKGQGAGGVEDKDLVLYSLRAGWSTGYTPDMVLTHIIPEQRIQLRYIEKLLPSVQTLWAQTLHAFRFESCPPISPATLTLRKAKGWLAHRAWRSPANRLRWIQSCGYLDGLAHNYRHNIRY